MPLHTLQKIKGGELRESEVHTLQNNHFSLTKGFLHTQQGWFGRTASTVSLDTIGSLSPMGLLNLYAVVKITHTRDFFVLNLMALNAALYDYSKTVTKFRHLVFANTIKRFKFIYYGFLSMALNFFPYVFTATHRY